MTVFNMQTEIYTCLKKKAFVGNDSLRAPTALRNFGPFFKY